MLSKWYFDTVHVPANNLFGILDDLDRKNHHHKADTVDEEGVKIELPGVKVCDINIDISDRSLRVSGKSRHGKEFHYAYGLGPEIDSDLISAKFQILQLHSGGHLLQGSAFVIYCRRPRLFCIVTT